MSCKSDNSDDMTVISKKISHDNVLAMPSVHKNVARMTDHLMYEV